jgi:hypothetical protein
MNTKHTPGPWRVTVKSGLPDAVVAPDPDLGSVGICKIVVLNDHEANARLIAAVPDLLAALQEIDQMAATFKSLGAIRNRARNAISKAGA